MTKVHTSYEKNVLKIPIFCGRITRFCCQCVSPDSLEKDEEKFINFKKLILKDDKFLNQYSNDKDDDDLLIRKQTIDKVKASRRLFIAVARKISLTKKINEPPFVI
ncbi:hypothetical protein [Piscirickettsia salmonis]|uniref:hypothetical protein n=1 Tax=Piscirickettsia salmonis TaxID=1238 RepID=UPI000568E179|nr:hypothetical protein [Piscirickettsia salmonis]ALT18052.1 hypothetical protein PSLF89_03460 [Piscirickettsia salmonis LF-89 = ATCC VR-1361]ALY01482.1 hypothetical protein AWE47_00175 [Piscirickettsia salmonis]AMA40996.1 hypothetical protein AWJ11_00180 [Piscirickettsia salmonis]AOS36184.1 hypothetical protein AVM72_13170 [Piscirickettsia salmonis]APS64116.1 hypothetical protein AVI54_10105 [Piscirickettsia salmonis]